MGNVSHHLLESGDACKTIPALLFFLENHESLTLNWYFC